jgi:hypothetical protein
MGVRQHKKVAKTVVGIVIWLSLTIGLLGWGASTTPAWAQDDIKLPAVPSFPYDAKTMKDYKTCQEIGAGAPPKEIVEVQAGYPKRVLKVFAQFSNGVRIQYGARGMDFTDSMPRPPHDQWVENEKEATVSCKKTLQHVEQCCTQIDPFCCTWLEDATPVCE